MPARYTFPQTALLRARTTWSSKSQPVEPAVCVRLAYVITANLHFVVRIVGDICVCFTGMQYALGQIAALTLWRHINLAPDCELGHAA